MSAQEFVQDLRSALSLGLPAVDVDHEALDRHRLARVISSADLWLTPKIVERYRVDDFEHLSPSARIKLTAAVEAFRKIADGVPSDEPATQQQSQDGWRALWEIIATLQPMLRAEWQSELNALMEQASQWCADRNWVAKKQTKRVNDRFLGEYEAPQLLFAADDKRLLLDPVARFASSSSGVVDLAVLPSFDSTAITKTGNHWYIHPVLKSGARREWSKQAFLDAVEQLGAAS